MKFLSKDEKKSIMRNENGLLLKNEISLREKSNFSLIGIKAFFLWSRFFFSFSFAWLSRKNVRAVTRTYLLA